MATSTAIEKMNYAEMVSDSNGESTLGSKHNMNQTEFAPALDTEVTPPNQLRHDAPGRGEAWEMPNANTRSTGRFCLSATST